jgi:protein-S-isoprenylcysteine O-methyltransferase Ste14
VYALPAYVLYVPVFRWRYGRSPVVERFPPRNVYDVLDQFLGVGLVGYSAWIVLGPPPEAGDRISLLGGLAAWLAGGLLRIWAVWTLGPNWRIGQDPNERDAVFVATGPYRYFEHPINTGLVLVAIGQALLTGVDARAMLLLGVSVVYLLAQAGAEKAFWKARRKQ